METLQQYTTEQLKNFLAGMASGYFTYTITDPDAEGVRNMVVFKKQYNVDTGLEIDPVVAATVHIMQLREEIESCQFRITAIEGFIQAENLGI